MSTPLKTPVAERAAAPFDDLEIARIRREFPILEIPCNDHPLIYLDNAATSQKPHRVLCALDAHYRQANANVHRGVHTLSERATDAYEGARKKMRRFLNARLTCEIVFTRGATEGINLVAQTYGRTHVGAGDEVLVTHMEHHSNIVPWQLLCAEKGATLRVVPITEQGEVRLDEYARLLNERTKLAAIAHVSNALGTVNPVKRMIRMAHEQGAPVLLDGAQSAPHMPIDVEDLDCDFFAFSGHKMYGPTGIGVLYGRAALLEGLPPYQAGGDMILSVTFEKTTFNSLPHRYEAGTPDIAGAVGLGAAAEFMTALGIDRIAAHERELVRYGSALLDAVPGVRQIGTAPDRAGVLSFTMDCAHPHDIGQMLDEDGIAVRAGHHCAQPVMQFFGVPATARASVAVYNTKQELDALAAGLERIRSVFS